MGMSVLDSDQEPGSGNHEEASGRRPKAGNLPQECPRERDREPGGGREESGGPCRSEVAQRGHEQHHRKSIADKADGEGRPEHRGGQGRESLRRAGQGKVYDPRHGAFDGGDLQRVFR